ncbi:DUF6442 family protein [Enterococcus sp. HY326]|uniref:DUF6442 family protein n=1 Tax=Enterococcus sp. HY326 TaxID=2971265 RepID=UPI00223ECD41|nr:DUF6442 family protein [Enterococcus sp. HY326]
MDKEKILKKAQHDKQDERKNQLNDFSIGTTGAFLLISIAIITLLKIIFNQNYLDMLGLLVAGIGAYIFGYAAFGFQKSNFFSKQGALYVVSGFLMVAGIALLNAYFQGPL